MHSPTHKPTTHESISHHAERALEHGHVNRAARFMRKLVNTPHNERVDILRAATTVLSGEAFVIEQTAADEQIETIDDNNQTPEFSQVVLQLIASSMRSLRLRDEKLSGILGLRKRDAQFQRGAHYLATHSTPDQPIAADVLLPGDREVIPRKQIQVLEDYLGMPRKDRERPSLNPLSH